MTAEPGLPRTQDDASGKFEQFAENGKHWNDIGTRHADELIRRARAEVATPNKALCGAAAAEYLEALIASVSSHAMENVNGYGPVRWLWYLRRMPYKMFEGWYGTTLGYDSVLAETLSWYSQGRDQLPSGSFLAFRADESAFRHTCKLVAAAKLLSDLHAQYRRVGKGATLNLALNVPSCEPDARLNECIQCYDERVDEHGTDFAGQGLSSRNAELIEIPENADLVSSMRLFRRCMPIWTPAIAVNSQGARISAEVLMKFAFAGGGARQFLDPYNGVPARLKYLQEIEPLILLLVMFPLMIGRFAAAMSTVMRFGYTFVHEQALSTAFDDWLPHVVPQVSAVQADIDWSRSYSEWRRRIDKIAPSMWPLEHGGVVRQLEGAVMLDLAAASGALLALAKIDRQDTDTGNVRAQAFELQVQQEIEKTAWAPPKGLAALRGRTIRRGGKEITDIDALGANERTLLLISCKSLIYDSDYDKGSHRVVRNAEDVINSAVEYWNQIVADFRSNPLGDNYDFSQFDRIIGVVCTPFVIYSSSSATLDFVAVGLRACSSESELRTWLSVRGTKRRG